jgi:L-ribulose-5-phosphate 3-epimerase
MNRRTFISTAGLALAAHAMGQQPVKRRIKLGISTYSYWHFEGKKFPVEQVMDKAADLGVEGVDIMLQQMETDGKSPQEITAYSRTLKKHAFHRGLDVVCLSTHQNFVSPDPAVRQRAVDYTLNALNIADALGAASVRVFGGRWNTIQNFDEFMEKRGLEPPIEGHTEDDAFEWGIEGLRACIKRAEELGIVLALENHWGLTRSPEGLMRILSAIESPNIGVLMDTGNFLEDPYDKLKMIAPKTVLVQAKTYPGGGTWYTLDLDYNRIAQILNEVGFCGYVCLEMEGKEAADTGVPKSIELLRKAFGA